MKKSLIPVALTIAAVVAAVAPMTARAFPIAPLGTEGYQVIVQSSNPVVATYLGNSAAYSDDLFLALDGSGNPGIDGDLSNDLFVFNNHSSPEGSQTDIGSYAAGTELIFRLYVHNTGYNFYSGPPSRNPDDKAHARVEDSWQPSTTLVSFEDLYNTPEYPGGYNDLSFSFSNTTAAPVPEPASCALLGFGLVCGGLAIYRRRHVT